MKTMVWIFALLFSVSMTTPIAHNTTKTTEKKKAKIQVALCLDTSNSMDGLIDQAKSQLWKMVNELAVSEKKGQTPDIEIALYEYGNSRLSASKGYIRQVSSLTTDLDLISEKLFELTTRGGSEYCGWVIKESTQNLEWTKNNDDLKLIIIAGNEPFNQGRIDYKQSCKTAIKNGIMINTIFCGNYQEGVRTFWKNGADLTDGQYMNINQNNKVVHIPSPYDDKIMKLNRELNETYIGYGRKGREKKLRQSKQDKNAAHYGTANMVERAASKSQAVYKNDDWDLVDAMEKDEKVMETVEEEQLPEEMQKMTKKERKAHVAKKQKERRAIQSKIKELNKKRQVFIEAERSKTKATQTLDNVMLKAVRKQAESKKFKFKK